jgi:NTE family protein
LRDRELADGAVTVEPDRASLEAFGPDLHDRSPWQRVFEAGARQAAETAGRVAALWNAAR